MKYLLDTNTCIRYLNGRSQQVADRFNALDEGDAVVCSVVKAELFFGALRSQNPIKTLAGQKQFLSLFISLPFDDSAAEYYGQIRADLTVKGTPIGSHDLLIAAIALANNLILVTHNTREFNRVSGLKIEDWEAATPSS
ncbi:MAG: type II toxin-antitoxin system VapC family toxin [Anaerolineae bacterium]|nr:type II toxin-antitoxin system VapC family toxin [Anaerolineae bacterium]MBN8621256.1 type II toxin-antitoxin system VapC family toxin [Anaerolineae bacterium]